MELGEQPADAVVVPGIRWDGRGPLPGVSAAGLAKFGCLAVVVAHRHERGPPVGEIAFQPVGIAVQQSEIASV